jgi:hypothetical protein
VSKAEKTGIVIGLEAQLTLDQCKADNPWVPCEYCQTHDVEKICVKIRGAKADPSRPPPTPIDAVIPHEEVLLLHFLYDKNGYHKREKAILGDFFKKLGAYFGPSIPNSQSLRLRMLYLASRVLDLESAALTADSIYDKICQSKLDVANQGDYFAVYLDMLLEIHFWAGNQMSIASDEQASQVLSFQIHVQLDNDLFLRLRPFLINEMIGFCFRDRPDFGVTLSSLPDMLSREGYDQWFTSTEVLCDGPWDPLFGWRVMDEYINLAFWICIRSLRHLVRNLNLTPGLTKLLASFHSIFDLGFPSAARLDIGSEFPPAKPTLRTRTRPLLLGCIAMLYDLLQTPFATSGIASDEAFETVVQFLQFMTDNPPFELNEDGIMETDLDDDWVLILPRILSLFLLVVSHPSRADTLNGTSLSPSY